MSRRLRHRESPWRARLRRLAPYAGGGLIVLVLMHTLFGPYGYFSMRRSEQQMEQLRQEIDRLDRENQQLNGEIRALQTDPSAVEKVAREDMGLARPGELIFRLPEDPNPSTPSPASPQPPR
jgi:cell division protein FtsB